MPLLRNAARALADALPNGERRALAGQTHDIAPEPTAAALAEFLAGQPTFAWIRTCDRLPVVDPGLLLSLGAANRSRLMHCDDLAIGDG